MRQLNEISQSRERAAVLLELTSAYEDIASIRIAKIKDQTLKSSQFFDELWRIYSQLKSGSFDFGRHYASPPSHKRLLILITSQGGLAGDLDEILINEALRSYDKKQDEVVVVGLHGVSLLRRRGIQPTLGFKLPLSDSGFNIRPLVSLVQKYKTTQVYYPTYVSLMEQVVRFITLGEAITQRGAEVKAGEVIDETSYIFEPSAKAVVEHLESAMTGIALSEVILEAKLAQHASRYRANSAASQKANETLGELNWLYNRAKRQIKDERLKENISGLRASEQL